MAFHEIKIGSKSFELAPTYIQNPATASTTSINDYGFLLFRYDDVNRSICKLYSPSAFDLPLIKYNSGNLCLEGNILPIIKDYGSVGSSDRKFNTMYATTFYGDLSGNAKNATNINVVAASTTNASYYIQFVNGTSGNKKSYTDTNLKYNPYTNTLTTTNFAGTATNATYINVAAANTTDASYHIQFVNGASGNRKSYTDANLLYNPKNNVLQVGKVNGNLNGPVQTTATSTHASYYISFVNSSSTGMRYSYVDSGLYYNPSTNTLTTGKLCGYFVSNKEGSWATAAHNGQAAVVNDATGSGGSLVCLASMTAKNGRITIGTLPTTNSNFYFSYHKTGNTGNPDKQMIWDYQANTLSATKFIGNLEGNADTATNANKITTTKTTTTTNFSVVFSSNTAGSNSQFISDYLRFKPAHNSETNGLLSITGMTYSSLGFYETSDERLKDFKEDIEVNFSYLHNIPKKYYSWKEDATYTRHIGTSAQEVQKYYPELVNVDETGYLTMNYDKLSVVALKAIDVLHEEVTELKKENAELKERLAKLEELILNK